MGGRFDRWGAALAAGWSRDPNGTVITTGRALLALGTALTMLLNSRATLFHVADPAQPPQPHCSGLARFSWFCVGGIGSDAGAFEWRRVVALVVLAVVVSGFVPALTVLPQWYVSASVFQSIVPMDGGDQVTVCLTFLLIPVVLLDRRWSGWRPASRRTGARFVVANLWLLLVPLQVAVLYFQSGVAKAGSAPWAEGTALWYWMQHPAFGAPDWLRPLALSILSHAVAVALLTWGTMVLEVFFCVAVFLGWRVRRVALLLGLVFHLAIVVVIGLLSFGLAMSAALVLSMIRPRERPDLKPRRHAEARPAKEPQVQLIRDDVPLAVG